MNDDTTLLDRQMLPRHSTCQSYNSLIPPIVSKARPTDNGTPCRRSDLCRGGTDVVINQGSLINRSNPPIEFRNSLSCSAHRREADFVRQISPAKFTYIDPPLLHIPIRRFFFSHSGSTRTFSTDDIQTISWERLGV